MLQSLERQSGLPIAFDPALNRLRWPEGIIATETSERTFAEMREFIAEADAASTGDPIYAVYRSISRQEDEAAIRAARLRYDITVIPPGKFISNSRGPIRIAGGGRPEAGYSHAEFFRTAGHYHPLKPGIAIAYPEVFEVISGRAYWLLQRPSVSDNAVIEEIYAIEAGPGEKAVILPGFGNISINAYGEPLILANWISYAVHNDYAPFKRLRGGGYWAGPGPMPETIEFEKNSNYRQVPELKKLRPAEVPEFGFLRSKPLYSLVNDIGKLRFLNDPEEFTHLLTLDHCYRPVV